jgi:peptide/nickel transport system substrate-binding protein
VLAFAGLLALGGCGSDADSALEKVGVAEAGAKPAYGDTFIDVLLGNISGLIPNIVSDAASFNVGGLIYSGLVTRDRDLNHVGDLAESWTYSADCRDITFKLRPDVRWHDGRPFTSADVLFTYETMINPKTPTAYREGFRVVESVETPDPATVVVHYKQPYAKALDTWAFWMLPKHLLESYRRWGRGRTGSASSSRGRRSCCSPTTITGRAGPTCRAWSTASSRARRRSSSS